MLGVLGLAAVLWLNQLNGHVQDQARAIQDLEKAVRESAERQRVAFDAVTAASDGKVSDRFVEQYARAARERDDARQQLANQATVNDLLATKTSALAKELGALKARYDEAKKAPELNARIKELEASGERQARKIQELDELLDSTEGRKAAAMSQRYQYTWYAAVGGWAVSLVLALSLVAGYVYLRFPPEDEPEPEPEPPAGPQPPPHRIT
jgi:chromosome segregation ATPase